MCPGDATAGKILSEASSIQQYKIVVSDDLPNKAEIVGLFVILTGMGMFGELPKRKSN